MRTVRFGRTGAEVSVVSLGSWAHGGPREVEGRPVGWFGTSDSEVRDTLAVAAGGGINHWDTADVYGGGLAEKLIGGIWNQVPRNTIFLASKIGYDAGGFEHYYHPTQIRRQLETSLRHLRTDRLDLYYLHHCDFGPQGEYLDDAVDALRRLREEGKIRFIGLSDWKDESIMRYVAQVDPDVVQSYRNVVDDTYAESGLRRWVDDNDLGVAFFSPLKHGLLLGELEGPATFGTGDHRNTIAEFRDYGLLTRLQECRRRMCERLADRSQPMLDGLIGAVLYDAPNGCAIVGLRRGRHARAAIQAGDRLSDEDVRWVHDLYQRKAQPTRAVWKSLRTG